MAYANNNSGRLSTKEAIDRELEGFGVLKSKMRPEEIMATAGGDREIRLIRRRYRRDEQGEKPCCLKTENTQPVYWLEG